MPACATRRLAQRFGIRLANRQGVRTDHRGKSVANIEFREKLLGQTFGLVRADAHAVARICQGRDGCHRTGVEHGMPRDLPAIGFEKNGIIPVHLRRIECTHTFQPAPEHHSPAAQRNRRVRAVTQHIAMPHVAKTRICRVDQVAACIGQRSIKIEYHRAHVAPCPFFAFRHKFAKRFPPLLQGEIRFDALPPCTFAKGG